MNLLLDTNAYVEFCSGEPQIVDAVKNAINIYFPLIVIGELRAGFECGSKKQYNEKILDDFLNEECVEIIYPNNLTSRQYSLIFKELRIKGKPIPTNDIWIAALAIQNNMILITKDTHFHELDNISIYE